MIADEIVKLTPEAIAKLLRTREAPDAEYDGAERRDAPRWPFPGAIELRPADADGGTQWFGTCRNVSETGLGMTCDQYLDPGDRLDIAVHLPEASFYGQAIVRYCKEVRGQFMAGLEFLFDD